MAELFLVRHAQASFGAQNYDKLSELGHEQSTLLGKYFASHDVSFDTVITGTMQRQVETSQGIHQSIKSLSFQQDSGWNEFDFTAIVSAYLAIHPKQKPSADSPRSDWYRVLKKAMLAWSQNELNNYKGESWQDFVSRVDVSAHKIKKSDSRKVLVVSSGGAMAVFLMLLLNLSIEQAIGFNLQIKNTSVNHFYFNSKGFQLSSFNNVPHLEQAELKHLISYS
jgi:broad specificity phosphatase PhoE